MGKFKQLTLEEREQLYLWRNQEVKWREIGRRLNRDHSGLIKEWERNTRFVAYLPATAQKRAERKIVEQRRKAPLKSMQVWLYVQEHLRKPYYWTPEEIAGRLSIDYPMLSIHHETIYRYIYSKKAKQYKLWEHLPLSRKKRMHKGGRSVQKSSKIPNAALIDTRPAIVAARQEYGHWETDNVIGCASDDTALSVTVERIVKLTRIAKVPRTANGKTKAVIQQLRKYPKKVRKTITTDNGGENTNHQNITEKLHMPVYFCHPYHSWEKGTVENTNGRLRRFIPKGMSIDNFSEKQIKAVENWLNNTPRKCLQYLTPYEKMQQVLQST